MSDFLEELRLDIEKSMLMNARNCIPYEQWEEHLMTALDGERAEFYVACFLNEIKFIKLVLTEEFGKDKVLDIFSKVEERKKSHETNAVIFKKAGID